MRKWPTKRELKRLARLVELPHESEFVEPTYCVEGGIWAAPNGVDRRKSEREAAVPK